MSFALPRLSLRALAKQSRKIKRIASSLLLLSITAHIGPAFAACYNPAGSAGDMAYNRDYRTVQYCNGYTWISTGSQYYNPGAVMFDGTNDYATLGSALTGVTTTKIVSGSFWFRRTRLTGAKQVIFSTYRTIGTNIRFEVSFTSADKIQIVGKDNGTTAGTTRLDVTTAATFTDDNWHHVLFMVDLSSTSLRGIYVDGSSTADASTWTTYSNTAMSFNSGGTSPNNAVGAIPNGNSKFYGVLADVWINPATYVDFTNATNRAKFISSNRPVYLGATGQLPTGTAPIVFLSGSAGSWHTNKGTGGGFTLTGTLDQMIGTIEVGAKGGGSSTNISSQYLIGHWKLDDGSGTSAVDSSGAGNTGTLTGGGPAWTTSGKVTGAATFDGVDDYINFSDIASMDGMTAFTVSAWIKTPAYGSFGTGEKHIADKSYCNGMMDVGSFEMMVGGFGAGLPVIFFSAAGGTPANYYSAVGPTSVDDGMWHHLVGTYNGSNLILYVDGIQRASTAATPTTSSTAYNFQIGGDCNGHGGYYWYGDIDDVRVYNTALSASDVLTLYQRTTVCSNPTGYSGDVIYNDTSSVMQYCNGKNWIPMGKVPGTGGSGCSNPTGTKGDLRFNTDYSVMQYCDGTNWVKMGAKPVAPTSGLIGYWALNETSGTSVADTSGGGYNGTMQGGMTGAGATTTGKLGTALTFDGIDDYINLGDVNAFDGLSAFTTAAWIKTSSIAEQDIFAKSTCAGGGTNDAIEFLTTGGLANINYHNGSGIYSAVQSTTAVNDNQWHHIVGTSDGTTLNLYIDGKLDATLASGSGATASNATSATISGCQTSGYTFNGSLDDIRVYNRVLTPSEIRELFYATGGP